MLSMQAAVSFSPLGSSSSFNQILLYVVGCSIAIVTLLSRRSVFTQEMYQEKKNILFTKKNDYCGGITMDDLYLIGKQWLTIQLCPDSPGTWSVMY